MHHGQSSGKRKTQKVCKKHVNFTFAKVGGNNNFPIQICSWWLKKVIRNFGGWKSEIFFGKGKTRKIVHEFENFYGNREKSEAGGNASLSQGWMDASEC